MFNIMHFVYDKFVVMLIDLKKGYSKLIFCKTNTISTTYLTLVQL